MISVVSRSGREIVKGGIQLDDLAGVRMVLMPMM